MKITDGDLERAEEIIGILETGDNPREDTFKHDRKIISEALAAERRRTLELPEIKAMGYYVWAWTVFSNGEPEAKKILENFNKLLSKTKGEEVEK